MLTIDNLPKNFDWEIYLLLNSDIKKAGFNNYEKSIVHWLTYGYKENRLFSKSDLDTIDLNKLDISIQFNGFDPRLYKLYNRDLANFSNENATRHYLFYGRDENRKYYIGTTYEDYMQIKENQQIPKNINDSILLINHDISKTGAPIFLYDLYDYIVSNQIFNNVYMIESYPNNILPSIPNKLYHFNNLEYFNKLLNSINPALIYSNSLNFYICNIDSFDKMHQEKTILHFHETYQAIQRTIHKLKINIKNMQTYVVSDKLKNELLDQEFTKVDIFPPFISHNKQKNIQDLYDNTTPIVSGMDTSKITIGMCGTLNDRKNILLFLKLADCCPQYNFLWIGGDNLLKAIKSIDPNHPKKLPNNFYWVKNTDNPYQYFKLLDYFFLTSKEDPCPIVVLENLLLNKKIIVIKDNIKTDHNIKLLENYFLLDNDKVLDQFGSLNLNKDPNQTNKNIDYIKKYYSIPEQIINIKNNVSNK